ncbi:MAG TPA: LacI family DNA-binding transcriptional regulator, partial [Spirochaetia bacterium]|nr:LacI family DNA-binding transcriptional regulator [Spirochaetia bacterium]
MSKSMKDIAAKAGVSVSTVSRVLNNTSTSIPVSSATIKKIKNIAQKIGYRPNVFARSLRTNKSNMIGVMASDITDPFTALVLEGIDIEITRAGFRLLLSNAHADPAREAEGV